MSIAVPARAKPSLAQRFTRALLDRAGAEFRHGRLSIEFPDGTSAAYGGPEAEPSASIRVHDDRFFRKVLLDGEIGLGESYMDGLWSADSLTEVLKVGFLNRRRDTLWVWYLLSSFSLRWNRRRHLKRRNTVQMAKENIHDHYDLGNDFFRLWLDPSMTYSCALFRSEEDSLEQAQMNKYRAICEKAGVDRGGSVLEIGTGWGGLALFAAREYGCKVTTISISEEQVALARQRVEEAGLSSQIDVQLRDYRDVGGQFDSIVSIEMLEAVGAEYFETFFQKCDQVLRPGGRMSVQVITVADRSFEAQRKGVNWLNKHIFPGGVLPSIAAIEKAQGRSSLIIERVEDIGLHYVKTLRTWRDQFFAGISEVKALGFTDVFVRKWDYYLSSCEAAFATRTLSDIQIVLEKPAALP